MTEKPITSDGYKKGHLQAVRATCLYIATKLGDLMDDLVIIGGLVPSLIIKQDTLPAGVETHVGTMDLDVGLTIGLLRSGQYRTLTERLRRAGFERDVNEKGNPTFQRWRIRKQLEMSVDFLIEPSGTNQKGGRLVHIEPDFAAIVAPGLHLAFRDRLQITLSGKTIMGEQTTRKVWVAGPGAFVVLKSLAFDQRGENKDAYDLYYVVRNFGEDVGSVFSHLEPLLKDPTAREAIEILRRDFSALDGVGPRRVAEFLVDHADEEIQADVVGFVGQLLELCGI